MKKSIILDIFNGVRGNRQTLEMPKEENAFDDVAIKTYEELSNKLSPELFDLFKQHVNAISESLIYEMDLYSIESFKLGLLLGIECKE